MIKVDGIIVLSLPFNIAIFVDGIGGIRIIKFAESLGGTESLITYPTTQTHADVKEEVRLRNGITPCTLRLSTGIEDVEDLLGDLESAFAGV